MVCHNIRLSCGVSVSTSIGLPRGTSTRCRISWVIATICKNIRLIHSDPMLHSISEFFEAKFSEVHKIIPAIWITFLLLDLTFYMMLSHFLNKVVAQFKKIKVKWPRTYTTRGLKKPLYSSSSVCGRSQWYIVTNGCIPVHLYTQLEEKEKKKKIQKR